MSVMFNSFDGHIALLYAWDILLKYYVLHALTEYQYDRDSFSFNLQNDSEFVYAGPCQTEQVKWFFFPVHLR